MSVLCVLGNSELLHTCVADNLTQRHCDSLGLVGNINVGHSLIVLCHTDIVKVEHFVTLEAVKLAVNKSTCDFSCSVRAEVEEYNTVAALDCLCLLVYAGYDEFVCYAVSVGFFHHFLGAGEGGSIKRRHCTVCLFNSVPLLFAVHNVVSAHYAGDCADTDFSALSVKLNKEVLAACGGYVTAVHKAVNENLFKAVTLCKLKKSVEVCVVAVNAAVGYETHKVKRRAVLFTVFNCFYKCFVLKEIAVGNGL